MKQVLPLLPFLILLSSLDVVAASHVYTDSFPTYDEYDFATLDPEHVYGSPYGGFSRATQSRLAALPLHLPALSSSDNSSPGRPSGINPDDVDDSALYMQVRDSEGRLFVCRVYREDELEPDSLNESMFDAPKLRHASSTGDMGEANAVDDVVDDYDDDDDDDDGASAYVKTSSSSLKSKKIPKNEVEKLLLIMNRLALLEGICGQIHKGWWSYEWCFEAEISQFHIEIDATYSEVRIQDPTSLGTFRKRTITDSKLEELPPNEWAEDVPELARVVDIHDKGSICSETDEPRKSFVQLMCCSEKVTKRRKGMIHKDGKQVSSSIAALLDVIEDPEHVCHYNITVCTPLLCGEEEDDDENDTLKNKNDSKKSKRVKIKENETIPEILDRALGNLCLQTSLGGWWTYEICHKQSIRQFHEVTGTRRNAQGAAFTSRIVESEHVLGKYNEDDEKKAKPVVWGEEWELVVNASAVTDIEESGTYFEVEYINGDFCDHSDVTDSAIVAGTAGAGGLARASSVRYFCGPKLDVSVNEDSTCHYIVEVSVPPLCKHPLFREPVSQKQVVKCLPAAD